jgi:hypothetical protein
MHACVWKGADDTNGVHVDRKEVIRYEGWPSDPQFCPSLGNVLRETIALQKHEIALYVIACRNKTGS